LSANHPSKAQEFCCGDGILWHSKAVELRNKAITEFLLKHRWINEDDLVDGEVIIDRNSGPSPVLAFDNTQPLLDKGEIDTLIAWADTYIDLHDLQEVVVLTTHTPCGRGGEGSDNQEFAITTLINAFETFRGLLNKRLQARSDSAQIIEPKTCFAIYRCEGPRVIGVDMYTTEQLIK